MDRVSRAVLMMIAAAIFGMSLLIAYGASDLKSEQDAKINMSPTETVEIIPTPSPIDAAADEELVDEADDGVDDEDFEDFGKPVIDLDEETDEASNGQNAADAAAATGEAAAAAGEAAAAAGSELVAESASQ